MEVYRYSLCVSLTLMLFFSWRFFCGKLPDKKSVKYYKRSRQLMGAALLNLSINYSVHLFITPRQDNPVDAILMNLCTYWLAVWLFGSAMMLLLDRTYVTPKRFRRHIAMWVGYCLIVQVMWHLPLPELMHQAVPVLMAALFLVYAIKMSLLVFATFRRTTKMLDNYYADNATAYIRWMSVFTYWAVFFGAGQGIFTFVPDRFVFIWIISAIPFYIYLYVSYSNYLLFYEHVEDAIDQTEAARPAQPTMSKAQEEVLEENLNKWVEAKAYTKPKLTIEDLSVAVCTNRTYIYRFLNAQYGMTFREWVNSLRLEYAKELMLTEPDLTLADVAAKAGYMSPSYFSRTFKEAEGVTPTNWMEMNK